MASAVAGGDAAWAALVPSNTAVVSAAAILIVVFSEASSRFVNRHGPGALVSCASAANSYR